MVVHHITVNVAVHCHLGWRTLVLKCNKNNYDWLAVHVSVVTQIVCDWLNKDNNIIIIVCQKAKRRPASVNHCEQNIENKEAEKKNICLCSIWEMWQTFQWTRMHIHMPVRATYTCTFTWLSEQHTHMHFHIRVCIVRTDQRTYDAVTDSTPITTLPVLDFTYLALHTNKPESHSVALCSFLAHSQALRIYTFQM